MSESFSQFLQDIIRSITEDSAVFFQDGGLASALPLLMFALVSLIALLGRSRLGLFGYIVGWVVALVLIGLYQQNDGDNLLAALIGLGPGDERVSAWFAGFLAGFLVLLPFIRLPVRDARPIILAVVLAGSLCLLILAWRAEAAVPVAPTGELDALILFRRRYVSTMAIAFYLGVLGHVLISAAGSRKLTLQSS